MDLVRATAVDVPEIVELANVAYRGGGEAAGWTTEAAYIEGERLTEPQLHRDLAGKPDACLMLHRGVDGRLIGTVWLEPKADGVWYLGLLTVQPSAQNAGLGRQMLSAAEEFVGAQGGNWVRMTVVNVRETLIAWYERRGYRRTGEVEAFPYGDERFGKPLRDDLAFVVLEKSLGLGTVHSGRSEPLR
jgi:ribosomal protein S18 acetylase RimI-like enzyme